MDESIARGLMRQHMRRSTVVTEERQQRLNGYLKEPAQRLLAGRPIANPTAVMAGWRSMMGKWGAKVVPVPDNLDAVVEKGAYRQACAFWTGWTPLLLDYTVKVYQDGEVLKTDLKDQEMMSLDVMVDLLAVDRKGMLSACTVAPVQIDRHALQRWLQRQPGGDIQGFERSCLEAVPMIALQHSIVDSSQTSIGSAVPLGDGLLLGNCCERSGKDKDVVFGQQQVATQGKSWAAPALPVGTGFVKGDVIGGQFFAGQTFFGPRQLNDGLGAIREALVNWQTHHQEGLDLMWGWLARAALDNAIPALPSAVLPARNALIEIMTSDLWRRHVILRSSRAIARSHDLQACA